jgi:AcrR family transcriptional regulator
MSSSSDVSEQRRAQIIQAALSSFLSQGYNKTTMDDIVSASGLSKGTLYWYFDSKDQLLAAALMSVFEEAAKQAVSSLEHCTTASDRLRAIARAASKLGDTFEGFFGLFLEFWASSRQREEAASIWVGLLEEYKNIVVSIIEEGVESGEFRPVNAEPLVWAKLAAYDGMAAYLMFLPRLNLYESSDVFVETLLSGLQADKEASYVDRRGIEREGAAD